ncbi:conserved hypothetical protein [Theileria orientalis strain Shintoku]|uniref:AVL9/DENND6 domain-containing protein n=1 Tax=Theileria orientalis strain Shintoku TaxID=869250 RepID=J7MGV0_THEOR|nr:conserved hypothetical protein [Theileria orientalis strain Shintoku]BAM38786.1 conserved hypothetical protein [Theileria orientalis strain Shintoku]|eukprot:XP_009689087.1 conserved hypothetical protein [Theileria orientalis strain Shintoku]
MFDQINKSDPNKEPEPAFVLPAENILDLNLISSASDRNEENKEDAEKASESQVFLTDDQIFSAQFKEIKLDAKPMDLSENTPKSTSLESDTSTPASKQSQSSETVNYSNFESATFKEHITRDSLDSVAYLNLELDGPRTQTGKVPPPLEKPKEESAEVKNEFGKFYDNMYYTSLHGPPVVGAFILRNKDSRNEFILKHPQNLDPRRPGNDDVLKATYSSESYTAERDHTSELQSALHLLPGLAFGSQKKDSLVDFVHFVLPTASGNVLYGTSYVLQFTEKVETYGKEEEENKKEKDEKNKEKENENGKEKEDKNKNHNEKEKEKKEEDKSGQKYYVAICLVYTVPFFGVIGSRLEYVAQTYFDNKNFKDDSLLLSFVEHINKSDKPEEWSYESLFFNLEYHFKPFSLCLSYSKCSEV